jgi:hypothetical protein
MNTPVNKPPKYLLLNPLTLKDFAGGINTLNELREALNEFGCNFIIAPIQDGSTKLYITAPTKEALGNLCTSVNLDGIAVEYTWLYDQYKE